MKKLFALVSLIGALMPLSTQAQQSSGTLAGFLFGQGLAGAKLERRFGNHLFVPVSINNKRAALMIDTGAPVTLIDKDSATTFGLTVENMPRNVGGVFGERWERYGMGMVKSIAMGNCVLTNVPVALAEESSMNRDISSALTGSHIPTVSRLPHINGLLGSREMRKFGMMIDASRHWSRGTALVSDAGAGRIERIGSANVKELAIGGFTISNAETTVANISGEVLHSKNAPESNAGLLGAERLAFNFAIIDVGGMTLYLRHPDSR